MITLNYLITKRNELINQESLNLALGLSTNININKIIDYEYGILAFRNNNKGLSPTEINTIKEHYINIA